MVCYIGIGSNIGNRFAYIREALGLLEGKRAILIKKISDIYETKPEGGPGGQRNYLNLAVKLETGLRPLELLSELRDIERRCGRKARAARWAAREIDLDVLFYGSRLIDEKMLKVPHPLMHKRSFVLRPLSDIAPGFMHPVLKKSIKVLLGALTVK
ncbi:MAG TPA: 2-amino-4-hydroxy-6-hydroxymethyldihydropteridine diphosphokinase [Candidatus Omnitrophica bacterium]|nr:2-amino-4-hydroxy-6-hydroxymethyldihydropteridine diphosphokinase [Candidatus Omnitrophota bacterium]